MATTTAAGDGADVQAAEDRRLGQLLHQLRVPEGGFSPPPAAAVPAAVDGAEGQRKITAVLVGAGNRGDTYTTFALENPDLVQIIGVCDPNLTRRERIASLHSIPQSNIFASWEDLLAANSEERVSDAAIICTQDQAHRDPACAFASQGYHILLEKPMATTEEDCLDIYEACMRAGVMLAVCHVLRYTPYMSLMRSMIEEGSVGKVMNIQHLEPVGWWHHAHSYVRGNWRREDESSFFLMAKACHDVDLITYMMGDSKCTQVSSFGNLQLFNAENKPAGAASRCLDCSVEADCPYSAPKLYIEREGVGIKSTGPDNPSSFVNALWSHEGAVQPEVPNVENVTEALRDGPYGRCVFGDCDNDVVDNQVAIMEFETGATATLSVIACAEDVCIRKTRVMGSRGELVGDGDRTITHFDFVTGEKKVILADTAPSHTQLQGHTGADFFLMQRFVKAVATNDPSLLLTGPTESLRSHRLVFAAERARREQRTIVPDDVAVEELLEELAVA